MIFGFIVKDDAGIIGSSPAPTHGPPPGNWQSNLFCNSVFVPTHTEPEPRL